MFLRVFFLAFLFALNIDAAKQAWRVTLSPPAVAAGVSPATADTSLPNSCELIATEAHVRMKRTGIWSRILIVQYGDKHEAHALCVYQPGWQICAYDDTGTVELDTNSHDPDAIANLLAIRLHRPIKSARFLK